MLEYGNEAAGERIRRVPAGLGRPQWRFDLGVLRTLPAGLKMLILVCGLAGALGGIVVMKMLTPRYVATAQIYLDPRSVPGAGKEDAEVRQDSNGFINYVETQARIVGSRAVLERVVDAEKLVDDPEFGDAGGGPLSRLLSRFMPARPAGDARAGAVQALGQRISIRRPERTFIIEISATSREPEKAARLANAVADAYGAVQTAMQADSAKEAADTFSARLDGLRDRLIAAERRVEDYKAATGFVGMKEDIDDLSLRDLNAQLTLARARVEEARSRFEQVLPAQQPGFDLSALTSTLNLQALTNLRASQTEAQQNLADLSADLGPRHPSVMKAQARAAELKRLIAAELARVATAFRKDYDRARQAEEGLSRRVDELRQKSLESAQASVKLRELEREVEANRNIYESFLARSRQTAESQQLDSASTHVITRAFPPNARSFPPTLGLMTAAGLLVGLAAGLALAIWRMRREKPVPTLDTAVPERASRPFGTRAATALGGSH